MDMFWFVPFAIAGGLIGFLAAVSLVVFWIWMIIDCVKRKFNNDIEKIVWIVGMLFFTWIGSVAYLIIIKFLHPRGIYNLIKRKKKNKKRR